MLRSLYVALFAPLLTFTLLACDAGSGPADPPADDPAGELTVGAEGGVVSAHDGRVTLDVPADALSTETEITVDPVDDPPADRQLVSGTSFDFGPDGLVFQKPVTMELGYPGAELPEGALEGRLRVHKLVGSEWQSVAGEVDADRQRARAQVTSFSVYGVRVDPCATAPLSTGDTLSGRLDDRDCVVEDEDGGTRFEEAFALSTGGSGAFRVSLTTSDPLPGLTLRALSDGSGAGATELARSRPSEGTSAGFVALGDGGDYHLAAASREGAEIDFDLTVASRSSSNRLGCSQGMIVLPPVSGIGQSLDDGPDCVVTIEFPSDPEVGGKETVEEYYWIHASAGETITVTTARTGGDPDFTPFPTIFLGGGEVVQTDGDAVAPSKTISHTAERDWFFLLGVSSTLDENLDYTQGSYALSVSVE